MPSYTNLTAEQRVANGARWLDENFPGWHERINIETLDLKDGRKCICGRVFKEEAKATGAYDGYIYAENNLFDEANSWISLLVENNATRRYEVVRALGFMNDSYPHRIVTFSELQQAWVELLQARKG